MIPSPNPSQSLKQSIIFTGITLGVSFAFEAWMITKAGGLAALGGYGGWVLMFIPAIVSIGIRLAGREGFGDVGWRLGPWCYVGSSYLIPAACAIITYGLAFAFNLVDFDPPAKVLTNQTPPLIKWLVASVFNATAGLFIAFILFFKKLMKLAASITTDASFQLQACVIDLKISHMPFLDLSISAVL